MKFSTYSCWAHQLLSLSERCVPSHIPNSCAGWLQGYVDVAQHREWVERTGGTIYLYHPFDPTLDYDELLNDLLWNVRREQGLEALLRVRCSSGIDVESYNGAFLKRETGVTLSCDSVYVFGPPGTTLCASRCSVACMLHRRVFNLVQSTVLLFFAC